MMWKPRKQVAVIIRGITPVMHIYARFLSKKFYGVKPISCSTKKFERRFTFYFFFYRSVEEF